MRVTDQPGTLSSIGDDEELTNDSAAAAKMAKTPKSKPVGVKQPDVTAAVDTGKTDAQAAAQGSNKETGGFFVQDFLEKTLVAAKGPSRRRQQSRRRHQLGPKETADYTAANAALDKKFEIHSLGSMLQL